MRESIVITGVGMVTPLGKDPRQVLRRLEAGESAAAPPAGFEAGPFACPVCAQVKDFQPQQYVAEVKMVRLMNRDAQLAVAAAHLALEDARMKVGTDYAPEDIALFGATGMVGLPLAEVVPLIKASTQPGGGFDLARFGAAGLRAVSPTLSFKILSNMPVCFVSICENIQGPNGIYTPWEGQGAQAIEAGLRALECGEARCALAGGCDVKTHELAFIGLEQQGVFQSWKETKTGGVPGEGAVFLVLEKEPDAVARGARIYARVSAFSLGTRRKEQTRADAYAQVLKGITGRAHESADDGEALPAAIASIPPSNIRGQDTCLATRRPQGFGAMVSAGNGDSSMEQAEGQALSSLGIAAGTVIHPKKHAGDLFAAAAALQVGLAALLVERGGRRVLANCFGHGSEQASFVLEEP